MRNMVQSMLFKLDVNLLSNLSIFRLNIVYVRSLKNLITIRGIFRRTWK